MSEADSTKNLEVAEKDCSNDKLENTHMLIRKRVLPASIRVEEEQSKEEEEENTTWGQPTLQDQPTEICIVRKENREISIDLDELRKVLSPESGDHPVTIIAIASSSRTGKSFLMNFLARFLKNERKEREEMISLVTKKLEKHYQRTTIIVYACSSTKEMDRERNEREEKQRLEMERQQKESEKIWSGWGHPVFELRSIVYKPFSFCSDPRSSITLIQSKREIDGEGKRKLKQNGNGNDIFSDKNFIELFGMLKAESIYEMTKWEGNEWAIFATNNLGIPAKKLRAMRREVGSLTSKFMMESLKYWREKNGSNGADLVELVKKFMRITEVTSYIENIPFEDVCRAVVGLIGDESWMKFVRIELGLTEDEIKEMRMEYADFTEEQKFQIIKRWIKHEKKMRRNRLRIWGGDLQHKTQE